MTFLWRNHAQTTHLRNEKARPLSSYAIKIAVTFSYNATIVERLAVSSTGVPHSPEELWIGMTQIMLPYRKGTGMEPFSIGLLLPQHQKLQSSTKSRVVLYGHKKVILPKDVYCPHVQVISTTYFTSGSLVSDALNL